MMVVNIYRIISMWDRLLWFLFIDENIEIWIGYDIYLGLNNL